MNPLVAQINDLLKEMPFMHAFCGGFAIDLFLGRESRRHGDVDIFACWADRSAIIEVNEYFREISEKYQKSKVFSPDKMGLDFNVKSAPKWEDPHAMVYDAITEEDVHRIRHEIALVEKDPMDAVTYALYPEETKEYLSKRARQ